jgi:hypothetical protein
MPLRSAEASPEFELLVSKYGDAVASLARRTRKQILSVAPDGAVEEVDPKAGVIGYGVVSGYAGLACTIILSRGGVKLGLVGSASWPDPDCLLAGRGNKHRYVILNPNLVGSPSVARLLESAFAQAGERTRRK